VARRGITYPAGALALELRASRDDVLILLGDLRFCMIVKQGGETFAGKWAHCYGAIERDELRLYSYSRPNLSMVKSPLSLGRFFLRSPSRRRRTASRSSSRSPTSRRRAARSPSASRRLVPVE
jgi:hypothetical protein